MSLCRLRGVLVRARLSPAGRRRRRAPCRRNPAVGIVVSMPSSTFLFAMGTTISLQGRRPRPASRSASTSDAPAPGPRPSAPPEVGDDEAGLALEDRGIGRARGPVDGVLQHARDRVVVFRRHEDHAVGRRDLRRGTRRRPGRRSGRHCSAAARRGRRRRSRRGRRAGRSGRAAVAREDEAARRLPGMKRSRASMVLVYSLSGSEPREPGRDRTGRG